MFEESLRFVDRADAARRLAAALAHYRGANPLILAIPCGGVPMAQILAAALGGEFDVVLVRKLGAPHNPELAIGAIDESGRVELAAHACRVGADAAYVQREAARQLEVLRARRAQYSPRRPPRDPAGRTVIVVDDGLATGATMRAALAAVRARHPARLICAVPVAARDSLAAVRPLADEVVCLAAPADFYAVGQFYADFGAVEDAEVIRILGADAAPGARRTMTTAVELALGAARLDGDLDLPDGACGLVVFAHGSGSSRRSPRNRFVAGELNRRGLATLLFDLLTEAEDADRGARFDIGRLADRLDAAVAWSRRDERVGALRLGLFGASTGAAAALLVAAQRPEAVGAVVARGGRPDLAGAEALARVQAPTLLIVGGADDPVLELNRRAQAQLACPNALEIVPRATHLFEEPGALERVAELAGAWFQRWLARRAAIPG